MLYNSTARTAQTLDKIQTKNETNPSLVQKIAVVIISMITPPQKEAYNKPTGPNKTLKISAAAVLLSGNLGVMIGSVMISSFKFSVFGNIISIPNTVNKVERHMASLDLDENHAQFQIRGYQPGMIRVNDKSFTESIIITPSTLIEQWAPQLASDITPNSLNMIVELKPTILIIGTGEKHIFLSPEIYGHLINLGIGVEVMSTSAACRTYNALSAENRKVVAALIIK